MVTACFQSLALACLAMSLGASEAGPAGQRRRPLHLKYQVHENNRDKAQRRRETRKDRDLQGGNEDCTVATGVDQAEAERVLSILGPGLPYLFLPLASTFIGGVLDFETPIQFRMGNMHGISSYNTVARYHPTALDAFARMQDGDRICTPSNDPTGTTTDEIREAHEQISVAYTFAYSSVVLVPTLEDSIAAIMGSVLGLDYYKLFDDDADPADPWAMARRTVDEITEFQQTDGWNQDGTLTNQFNAMPYRDFEFTDHRGNTYTPYQVQPQPEGGGDGPPPPPPAKSPKSPKAPKSSKKPIKKLKKSEQAHRRGKKGDDNGQCPIDDDEEWFWKPLLESNGLGYLTRQEHVTPFIGFTGRLFGLTEDEYNSFSAPIPDYDWCDFETEFVLENTRTMATSDVEKMEVEFYDSKYTSLLPAQINYSISRGLSHFDFWWFDMTFVVAFYDATMLVWRDKVLFNYVRPTTVVHAVKQDVNVTTYGGPGQGVQTMQGQDWQPFIRTMPHAEYPSASACVCTVFQEVMVEWTGSDEIDMIGNGDVTGINFTFPAGSSFTEPGLTPAEDLTLSYNTWSSINQACGTSRENGGMHFSPAVPGGNELCSGVATKIVQRARLLEQGDKAGALADYDDRRILVKTKEYDRRRRRR